MVKKNTNNRRALYLGSNNGFTLIELLVIISIISLLASTVFVETYKALARSRFVRIEDDLRQISEAAQLFNEDFGYWAPDTDLATTPAFVTAGYLSKWPTPPCPGWRYDWDNYSYYSPDPSKPMIRISVRPNDIEASSGGGPNPSVLYSCLEDGGGDQCQWGDMSMFPGGGGIDFRQFKAQGITCREGTGWVTNSAQPSTP